MDVINLSLLVSFAIASFFFIMAPGPDTILLLGQGLAGGRKAGIGVAIGCALGCCFHTALASIGVTAIIASSDNIFNLFKYCGAMYLFYLGVKIIFFNKNGAVSINPDSNKSGIGLSNFITRGFLSNTLNPKVALFFLSFIPQFVDPSKGSISTQVLFFGLTFSLILLLIFGLIGFFAGNISQLLTLKPGVQKWLDRMAGITCFALALRLVFTDRKI
jgi:threonine/homoserine/homoserine lactone efflux protein